MRATAKKIVLGCAALSVFAGAASAQLYSVRSQYIFYEDVSKTVVVGELTVFCDGTTVHLGGISHVYDAYYGNCDD